MPAVSSTRSSTTNDTNTLLSSVLQTPKQSSSRLASIPTGGTTPFPPTSLPSVPVTMSGTHVVTNPSFRPTPSLPPTPSLGPTPSLPLTPSLPPAPSLRSTLSLVPTSSLGLLPSLSPMPSSKSSMSLSATSTLVPCDTGILSSACAQSRGLSYHPSATGDSNRTTSRHSSSGTAVTTTQSSSTTNSRHSSSGMVVTTTHSTSARTSVASTVTPKSSSYMRSSTSQTTSTISHTTLPITSTTTFPLTPYSTLTSPSRIPGRLSSTPGYSSVSSPSVSQIPLTASSSAGSDSTLIIGSSVGAAAVFCSMAIVALLFHLRSRWRHSDAHPQTKRFVDDDPTVPRSNTPSESGVRVTMADADALDSFPEFADSSSGRGSTDSCATKSDVAVWPEEDRSAIARRTRTRELENIFPGPQKCSEGMSTRKREQRGHKKRGRRGNRGVDESEPHLKSRRKRAASSAKSETLMRQPTCDHLASLYWPMMLSRDWTNDVMAQLGKVKVGTGVVVSGRPSLSSMKPSVRSGPFQNCNAIASRNNVYT
ncbi:hypothetical protein EDD16DRAFT_1027036 [Pisolithus croceorrhizus]|nr:hypothetical protein EV401DRAFT_156156 [Pisolithus croceorrhizus]KAI6130780.1 hypothetical protein EDD16DRAFT_1027036 [Pisolithus croceorrhizus]KAI6161264.1 hypothetical protein EDD17DRAFT_710652 [Pisolithus thermaeus]